MGEPLGARIGTGWWLRRVGDDQRVALHERGLLFAGGRVVRFVELVSAELGTQTTRLKGIPVHRDRWIELEHEDGSTLWFAEGTPCFEAELLDRAKAGVIEGKARSVERLVQGGEVDYGRGVLLGPGGLTLGGRLLARDRIAAALPAPGAILVRERGRLLPSLVFTRGLRRPRELRELLEAHANPEVGGAARSSLLGALLGLGLLFLLGVAATTSHWLPPLLAGGTPEDGWGMAAWYAVFTAGSLWAALVVVGGRLPSTFHALTSGAEPREGAPLAPQERLGGWVARCRERLLVGA